MTSRRYASGMQEHEGRTAVRIAKAMKAVEAIFSAVSYALVAVLAVLYFVGVLEELWVVMLPALQLLALKFAMGAYYGAKLAPGVIDERYR